MKEVYIISTGTYSDYRIRAVCSTKEIAEEALPMYGSDHPQIISYQIDDLPQMTKGMNLWRVTMDKKGNVYEGYMETELCDYEEFESRKKNLIENGVDFQNWEPTGKGKGSNSKTRFYMQARNQEHAVKIANEKRTMLIANNQWCDDWDKWLEISKTKES